MVSNDVPKGKWRRTLIGVRHALPTQALRIRLHLQSFLHLLLHLAGSLAAMRKVAVVALGGNRVIRLQLDRRGGLRSIVRGHPLDQDCRHANLAVTFRQGTAAPIMAQREHHQQRAVRTLKLCFRTLVTNDISVLMSLGLLISLS